MTKEKVTTTKATTVTTMVIVVPILFLDNQKGLIPENLNPEKAKQKLDESLAEGFRIKIMNDFEYEHVVFTHYVLEKGAL